MKKKILTIALCGILGMSVLTGCKANSNTSNESKFQKLDTDLKVGMVVGKGSIDDRSFNQGTWEGIEGAVKNNKYLNPVAETEADYLKEIGNLYDGGFKFIITPGHYFETAIEKAQDKYKDAKFIILDGTPKDESGKEVLAENTAAITFAEHEAGFLAGVAAASEIKEGDFGFLGGMQIPNVQRFEAGFRQGIDYANSQLNTHITLKDENVVYQGTFSDKAAGQQIAAQMYDRDVKVIFTAAGGTGIGAITEAKQRQAKGNTAWIIGVDSDQYKDGIYNEQTGASVILTSAVKYVDQAAYDIIAAETRGEFPGGEKIIFSVATDGVGIPKTNPNLSEEAVQAVQDVYNQIKQGQMIVSDAI